MTNTTRKQIHALPNRPPPPISNENPTVKELLEKNEELERRLRKYKEIRKTTKSTIKPLIRPNGEAGNRKRGFNLYEAMDMGRVENGPVLYDRMRDSVRKASVKVGLDLGAHFKNQDHEKLGQVFHLVRKSYPYLTPDRFPHNWAIADMVKGYLAGTRKDHHRQAREEEDERKKKNAPGRLKKGPKDPDTDNEEDDENDVPPPSSSTKSRKSKKIPEDDDDDDDVPPPSSSTKSRKSKKIPEDDDDDEDDVPPPSSSTKARKAKKITNDDDEVDDVPPPSSSTKARFPSSSSSNKSGKLTRRGSAAYRDDDPNDETSARARAGGKSRKHARPLAAEDEYDFEGTPVKKLKHSRMGTSGKKQCTRSLGSEKISDNEWEQGPSPGRMSRGEEDNGEDQGGVESDVYAD